MMLYNTKFPPYENNTTIRRHLQLKRLQLNPFNCMYRKFVNQFSLLQSSLQSVFSSSAQHVSVKSQVCQLAQTIVDSLSQISFVFCAQQNQGGQVGTLYIII